MCGRHMVKPSFWEKALKIVILIWAIEAFMVIMFCEPRNLKPPAIESKQITQIDVESESIPGDNVPAISTYKPTDEELASIPWEVGPTNWVEHKAKLVCSAYTASVEECGKSDGITYSGAKVKADHTIAVDHYNPYFEIGTQIQINGIIYAVEDTGDLNKYGRDLDIYFEQKQDAINFGVRTLEVTWYEVN